MKSEWKKALERHFAPETLEAEQELSSRQPLQYDNWVQRVLRRLSRNFHTAGDLAPEYQAGGGSAFELPSFLVPAREVPYSLELGAARPGDRDVVREVVDGETYVRFFVHPAELPHCREEVARFRADPRRWIASPTSSHRSVFACEPGAPDRPGCILKLSLRNAFLGYPRLVEPMRVVRTVGTSEFVNQAYQLTRGRLPGGSRWCFLPEFFCAVPPGLEKVGFVARSLPEGFDPRRHALIPHLALLAESPRGRWIDRLFAASGETDRERFLWERIFIPLLDFYDCLALDFGLAQEAHKQNMGLVVDRERLTIESLFVRDMCGFSIDMPLRRHRKLPSPFEAPAWSVGMEHPLRLDGAQNCQGFNFLFLGAMNLDQLAKGFLPTRAAARLLRRANERHFAAIADRFGRAPRTLFGLGRFWDGFHRETATAEEYARVKVRERWNTRLYGLLRAIELGCLRVKGILWPG